MPATIRPATEAEAEQVRDIYGPIVSETAISFEVEPPTADEMRRRIAETVARFPWLVCERDGEVLGYAYACPHRARAAYGWSVDVSVYVRASARRSGVGRGLYTSLFGILALQGFHHAYAEQISFPSLRELAARTRLRADTTLELLPDDEFARDQAALERAAKESPPAPVVDGLDLLVLRRLDRG